MLPPEYEEDTITQPILAVSIVSQYDSDLWPFFPKIRSRDQEVLVNVCPYLELYRPFRFWYIRS